VNRAGGFLAVVLVVFAGIAAMVVTVVEPLDHGYIRYAAVADTMVRHDDFVVPIHDGRFYVLKPPLFVWCVALVATATRRFPEFASHVPAVLGGIAALLATIRLGRRMFSSTRTGMLAAGVLATMPEFASQWRGERIDPLFAGLLTLAIDAAHAAIVEGRDSATSSWRVVLAWAASGLWLGLATLTKGPIALLFAGLVVLPFARRTTRDGPRMGRAFSVAIVVWLLVVLPWPLVFLNRVGIHAGFSAIDAADFATRHAPPWEYVTKLPVALGPWALLLPAVAIWTCRSLGRHRGPASLAAGWVLLPLIALTLFPSRHIRYMAPVLPALALLIAGCVSDRTVSDRVRSWLAGPLRVVVLAVVSSGGAALLLLVAHANGRIAALSSFSNVARVAAAAGSVALVVLGSAFGTRSGDRVRLAWCLVAQASVVFATLDCVRADGFHREYERVSVERALATVEDASVLVAWSLSEPRADFVQVIARRDVLRCDAIRDLPTATADGVVGIVGETASIALLQRELGDAVTYAGQFRAWNDEWFQVLRMRRRDH
jgi:4-amino-4-deoxy-L-arabinose transferase-like glycosyltransferase